ncbi:uncharacterized protein DEA37_0009129 [Paragonimus westermani]|uniref:DUF4218 domain-containing protein n=1 Tax=Paragonimus westermani TaxID=34504 RepID=A0A5J4NKV9_9TREM|nr:uncharacterized protein DEA37_0009129 [Paragonimus westermani]
MFRVWSISIIYGNMGLQTHPSSCNALNIESCHLSLPETATSADALLLQSEVLDVGLSPGLSQTGTAKQFDEFSPNSQEGIRVARRITFPSSHSPLRTHESFIRQSNLAHHIGDSPFCDIPIDIVSTFPLDYMHLVCLGVTKRMFDLWLFSPIDRNLRLSANSVTVISARISDLQADIPCDFPRRCRPLTEVKRWKATEFRQFLLNIGPVVIRGILDPRKYRNLLDLFIRIHILCHPTLHATYFDFVSQLLIVFIEHFGRPCGSEQIVYNVHSLMHLPSDVRVHGSLDEFSAFLFESFMRYLKGCVHSPLHPAQQIYRQAAGTLLNPHWI